MTDITPFERRLAALLDTYADRAPTDADPVLTARLAAATPTGRWSALRTLTISQRPASVTLLAFAMLASMAAGAFLAGSRSDRGDPATILASYGRIHVGWVFVYEDGRVVVNPDGGPMDIQERRLSALGVQLVRSGALPAKAFIGMAGSVGAGVWADAEFRRYVPRLYAVCAWVGGGLAGSVDDFIGFLPGRVQAMLRGRERTYDIDGAAVEVDPVVPNFGAHDTPPIECSEITAEELDRLRALMGDTRPWDASFEHGDLVDGNEDTGTPQIFAAPILPHGSWQDWGG